MRTYGTWLEPITVSKFADSKPDIHSVLLTTRKLAPGKYAAPSGKGQSVNLRPEDLTLLRSKANAPRP